MALKATIDTLEEVPEVARDMYVARDGKFHISVDGLVPKDRLDEFRSNNIAFKREIDDLKKTYEGVDVAKYKTLTAKEQQLLDKTLIDAGKVEELVELRIAAMRTEHNSVVDTLKASDTAKGRQLEGLLIDNALRDAAAKSGVRPTAIDDVLLRGRQVFRLHEGVATAFEGDKPVYGKNSEPLSIGDWVGGLSERASHLFEPNTGGGAGKGVQTGGGTSNKMTRAQYDALPFEGRAAAIVGKELVD